MSTASSSATVGPFNWADRGWSRARELVLRMPLTERTARRFLMAWFTIHQSRLRRTLGDSTDVGIGKTKLRLDLREVHDVRILWALRRYGGYEPETTLLVEEILRPGDTFVDVGANNGYFAILASQFIGSSGTVYAVEPNPGAVRRLSRNVEINGLQARVHIVPCAAGQSEGTGQLYVSRFEDGWASLRPFATRKPSIPVRVVALDGLLGSPESIVMKLDAEGSELAVLQGMSGLLERTPNVAVILEWNHLFGSKSLWDYLASHFRIFEIAPGEGRRLRLEPIVSWDSVRATFLKNLLAIAGPRWDGQFPFLTPGAQ